MMQNGEILTIQPEDLLSECLKRKEEGYRLVQISSVTTKESYELTYSFGKGYELSHLRIEAEPGAKIMSISHIYECAFLYENEIHDLFGVDIELITLDYHGNLYRIGQKAPYQKKEE
jgi:ech hydrogenase subunit D